MIRRFTGRPCLDQAGRSARFRDQQRALVAVIDAHNKESLLTGLSQANTRNKPEDVDWSLGYLRPLQEIGVPTFATEYVSDQGLRKEVQSRLTELGFVTFFATLGLNRLPGADGEARN